MEFFTYPSPSMGFSSPSFEIWVERIRHVFIHAVSALLGNFVYIIFTFFFAVVGSLLGAMTGAIIGQETESGFLRGGAIGAITGALFSIEVFEHSCVLWQNDKTGIRCLVYLIDVIVSLLNSRLVRERVGPAMLRAVHSQRMSVIEASFEEGFDIFEIGGTEGLPGDRVENIPKIEYTDTSEDNISCSVCLQDLQIGDTVRKLPNCHHIFHPPCIDKWLTGHGSCPLCRRDL